MYCQDLIAIFPVLSKITRRNLAIIRRLSWIPCSTGRLVKGILYNLVNSTGFTLLELAQSPHQDDILLSAPCSLSLSHSNYVNRELTVRFQSCEERISSCGVPLTRLYTWYPSRFTIGTLLTSSWLINSTNVLSTSQLTSRKISSILTIESLFMQRLLPIEGRLCAIVQYLQIAKRVLRLWDQS